MDLADSDRLKGWMLLAYGYRNVNKTKILVQERGQ